MRLAEYTDYTLRVLMYCAGNPQRLVTIAEMAASYGLSKNHLMKVVNDLARQGLLETTRGRGGGVRLVKAPADIRIGDVVRASETDFRLVECFDTATNSCTLTATCRMRHLLDAALLAYFKELDSATLADIVVESPAKAGRSAVAPPRGARSVIPIRAAAGPGQRGRPAGRRSLP